MKSGRNIAGWKINIILSVILLFAVCLALCVGKYPITILESVQIIFGKLLGFQGNWSGMAENVVMKLRLPRVVAAVLVGSSLSISGAAYQSLFRNPLISPDFLGASSGACIGAAIAILLSLGPGSTQVFAFFGGITAVMLTTALPKAMGSNSNIMLVLSGIIVSGAMSSIIGLIKYVADPMNQLAEITYWQMGSLTYVGFRSLWEIVIPVVICMVLLIKLAWWITIISLGEQDAKTLGVNVQRIRGIAIICATILTASSVSISGTIGWIGLVVPHFGRMMTGPDNRRLMPVSALLGAVFLLFVDTLGRTIGKAELPLSILTGLIGAPFYGWLLYRTKSKLT